MHVHDCLGCAVLLCLVRVLYLACFFLSSFSSLIKNMTLYMICTVYTHIPVCEKLTMYVDSCNTLILCKNDYSEKYSSLSSHLLFLDISLEAEEDSPDEEVDDINGQKHSQNDEEVPHLEFLYVWTVHVHVRFGPSYM